MHAPSTWHHGLIADYWALVNLEAPEVDLYQRHLRSPVLDAGCGAGRLLAPLRERGFDVDGCDMSADMIERCRRRAPDATLWVSALHELDPERRYASIVCCGVFGLGSAREQDMQALQRLHDALLPGGTLILDNEEKPFTWRVRDWGDALRQGDLVAAPRRRSRRGRPLRIHDPSRRDAQRPARRARASRCGSGTATSSCRLLHDAGFASVDVLPGVDENTLVYIAARE